jgi:23S rRNA (guanosine2251-2'-O)-methyltransferase
MDRVPDRRPQGDRRPGGLPRRDGPGVNAHRPQADSWRRPPPPGPGPGPGPGVNDHRPQAAEPWRRPPPPGPGPGRGRSGGSYGSRPSPYRQPGFRPPPPPDPNLLGPDEELVAGRRPVEEAFVAKRPAIRLLVVPQRRQALERLVLHATSLRIPIVEVEGGTLTALAGFDGHQGIALVAALRRWSSVEEILARGIERTEPAFVLVLDSLEDPQNVGTLLRSAEAAGVHGVVFPTRHQAPLTPSAVKASAGAVEHLLLAPVDDLPGALSDLHSRGVRVVGAEAGAPLTARQADFRGPLAIVVGSEGQGLSPVVRRRCDLVVRIPMRGVVGSLNAAVAGSVLLFEAVAQRDPAGAGDRPAAAPSGAIADATDEAPAEATAPVPPEPAEPDAAESPPSPDDDGTVDEPTVDDADLLPGGPGTSA